MLIAWCLKGISENSFGPTAVQADKAAKATLNGPGICAAWLRASNPPQSSLPADTYPLLSKSALNAHVNSFPTAGAQTPYISLSAGCRERVLTAGGAYGVKDYPALRTALCFATKMGKTPGYVFRLGFWFRRNRRRSCQVSGRSFAPCSLPRNF
jgi:hypothetical protein